MVNVYRLSHPEYREVEKLRDRARKSLKYNTDEDYRNKVKERNLERYRSKIPEFRCCKTCDTQIEYKKRIVQCVECYKSKTNWNINKDKVEFIKDE